MADPKPKSSIPAWQKAQVASEPGQQDSSNTTKHKPIDTLADTDASSPTGEGQSEAIGEGGEASATEAPTEAQQLEKAKTFLQDADVKAAPEEKKRKFLESKGIPLDLIDQALKHASQTVIGTKEFADFKNSQQSQPASQPRQQQFRSSDSSAPPIITYPEFLVEAHKPPPIITAERLLNTTYVLAGISTLIYAASKHLVAPMSAELSDARHDFFAHSQSKVDEMNERLSKLASRIPPMPQKSGADGQEQAEAAFDDEEVSIDSDPTELFHRDIGVQTSPLPSPGSESPDEFINDADGKSSDPISQDVTHLERLHSQLTELTTSSERIHTANKEYTDTSEDLQQYIDALRYQSIDSFKNLWGPSYTNGVSSEEQNKGKDGIEELKKNIRSVKGAMLSARRFPAARGR